MFTDVDLTDPIYFKFTAIEPGTRESSHDTLEILSVFDKKQTLVSLERMMIFTSKRGEDKADILLAGVISLGEFKTSEETKFNLTATLNDPENGNTFMSVVWNEPSYGYCRSYNSLVIGSDSSGEIHMVNKTITVGPQPGASCSPEIQKNPSHIEIPDYIQNAFPNASQVELQQSLNKILSIDNNTYDVSSIYQGRVYIATMNDTDFEFHKMNELCKSAGGYLVEMDSVDEQYFIRDFLKSLDNYQYFTGANDVEKEGNFVYYNSKKPVTNVAWQEGEPNNGGGNESCVEILRKGLNDKTCTKKRGYICEIPLVDEALSS